MCAFVVSVVCKNNINNEHFVNAITLFIQYCTNLNLRICTCQAHRNTHFLGYRITHCTNHALQVELWNILTYMQHSLVTNLKINIVKSYLCQEWLSCNSAWTVELDRISLSRSKLSVFNMEWNFQPSFMLNLSCALHMSTCMVYWSHWDCTLKVTYLCGVGEAD